MKIELEFNLTRPAKKTGGDRYEFGVEKSPDHMVIYIPQVYSRAGGLPLSKVLISITNIVK